ncbi:hypothetical protein AAHZ94_35345, partial [Streptomyces sp. HSW2009]
PPGGPPRPRPRPAPPHGGPPPPAPPPPPPAGAAGADRLNYRELDARAARLAGLLAARGARPRPLGGVLLPRRADHQGAHQAVA